MTSTPVISVHPERGFLPAPDPLTKLPSAYAEWDDIGHDLPKLLAAGRVRTTLSNMPVLDPADLPDAAMPRAMMLLSFFGHAYVYQHWQSDVARCIPAAIARPWVKVAARLGRPPILSYASYALDNWRRLDPAGPIALGNLGLLQNFLGGLDEEWFVTVHVEIEARAAPALRTLPLAQAAAGRQDAKELERYLETVGEAIERMHKTLLRMPENCDPYIYYHRVRPFIHGWLQHPVAYEGVPEYAGEAQAHYGETGAQSTIVPCLDAALGIRHGEDDLRIYLAEMRRYMPRPHVAFLESLERGPSVRDFVMRTDNAALRERYDACVAGLEAFRSTHLEYARRYIQKQAQVGVNSTEYGTGGTPFMPYLKKHRDETHDHRTVSASSHGVASSA